MNTYKQYMGITVTYVRRAIRRNSCLGYKSVIEYCIVQNFDGETLEPMRNAQNFYELIVGFILRGKVNRENFDETLTIHQIRQSFLPSNLSTI